MTTCGLAFGMDLKHPLAILTGMSFCREGQNFDCICVFLQFFRGSSDLGGSGITGPCPCREICTLFYLLVT